MDLVLHLYSRDEQLERQIFPIDYKIKDAINELKTLDFKCLPDDDYPIEKGKRIVCQDELDIWHEFIVAEVTRSHDDSGVIVQVVCEDSVTELLGEFIEDKRPSNQTVAGALSSALAGTRWSVGETSDLGVSSTNFYRISAHEALGKIIETWGGEIQTRVVLYGNRIARRYIDILAKRGTYTGRRFEWTKDIESIKRTVSSEQIYTALYGYGSSEEIGDGFGRRIDFAEVNGGVPYVEDLEARDLYGPVNPDGSRRHIFGKFESEISDREELLEATKAELKKAATPRVKYEAKVINLAAQGFKFEGVGLGDEVAVIDDEIGELTGRVVRIIKRPNAGETEVTIGNYKDSFAKMQSEVSDTLQDFKSRAGVWDRAGAFDSDGLLGGSYLRDILGTVNDEINRSGGYVYIEDGDGLTTYDRPSDSDPSMAVQIKGAGIRLANSKLPDGTWDWRTAIDGNGIYTSGVFAETLSGNLVRTGLIESEDGTSYWNLNSGKFVTQDGEFYGSLFVDSQRNKGTRLNVGGWLDKLDDLIIQVQGQQSDIEGLARQASTTASQAKSAASQAQSAANDANEAVRLANQAIYQVEELANNAWNRSGNAWNAAGTAYTAAQDADAKASVILSVFGGLNVNGLPRSGIKTIYLVTGDSGTTRALEIQDYSGNYWHAWLS